MKFSFYIIIALTFIKYICSSTRKISDFNHDSFQTYIDSNKNDENKKLLIVFYIKNNTYCEDALKTIENDILKNYNIESGVTFGKIDIESEYLLSKRLNITRIPTIILIQGNYYYQLRQKADKYSLKELIELSKDNAEKKLIPEKKGFGGKIYYIITNTIDFISNGFYSMFKISLHKNIIIFLLILIFFGFLWLMQKFLCYICCCRCCCKCKKKKGEKIKKIDKNSEQKIIEENKEIDEFSENLSGSNLPNKEEENDNDNENENENEEIISKDEINNIFNQKKSGENIFLNSSKQKQE